MGRAAQSAARPPHGSPSSPLVRAGSRTARHVVTRAARRRGAGTCAAGNAVISNSKGDLAWSLPRRSRERRHRHGVLRRACSDDGRRPGRPGGGRHEVRSPRLDHPGWPRRRRRRRQSQGEARLAGGATGPLISELLLIVSAFFAPAAVSVASEAHPPTSVVVFVDFSASIRSPARAAQRRELETQILPFLAAGDRVMIAPIHDKTLT